MAGPGPGAVFGPHVRAFNYDGQALAAIAKVSFFAYATLKYGANVGENAVHGSDGPDTAKSEIAYFFASHEVG